MVSIVTEPNCTKSPEGWALREHCCELKLELQGEEGIPEAAASGVSDGILSLLIGSISGLYIPKIYMIWLVMAEFAKDSL